KQDLPFSRIIKTGDHAEQGRLAASGRAQQSEKLIFTDDDGDGVERHDLAIAGAEELAEASDVDGSHAAALRFGHDFTRVTGSSSRRWCPPMARHFCHRPRSR